VRPETEAEGDEEREVRAAARRAEGDEEWEVRGGGLMDFARLRLAARGRRPRAEGDEEWEVRGGGLMDFARLRLAARGRRRPLAGLQAEVVLSLALVMLAATTLLAAALLQGHEARWRELLGRALLAEAHAPPAPELALIAGTHWWELRRDGSAVPAWGGGAALDAETRRLAEAARGRREPLLRPGAVWAEIRFAAPIGEGVVAVARLPASASLRLRAIPLTLAGALLALDVAVFTAFGATVLRRRVVLPLRRLAHAARGIADGALDARVAEEGPREAVEVAAAFNEMSEALSARTSALEKAVTDLRATNRELLRTRAGLDRAERLAAVGRLAAGVAHEVGNPMGALLAFVDLARRDPGLAPASREHLARATEQGERVRRILRQLLDFARPGAAGVAPRPFDLAAAAREAVGLVRAQRRYAGVRLEVEVEGEPPPALADPAGVAQILLNLLLNAADAVLAAGGTRVAVLVRPAPLARRAGEPPGRARARRTPGGVECRVADDGCGIAESDRERIFDPFFTTKEPGEGTGLGLSNSLRLAEEMGGALELVEAPEGLRTAFALRLPAESGEGRTAAGCEVRTEVQGEAAGSEPALQRKDER
jgi:signal transduction histidine kinase